MAKKYYTEEDEGDTSQVPALTKRTNHEQNRTTKTETYDTEKATAKALACFVQMETVTYQSSQVKRKLERP